MTSGSATGINLLQCGKFTIIIMDAPSDTNSGLYAKELKALGVTDVVRTCEKTYMTDPFEREGIEVHEMTFPDGAPPKEDIIQRWIELICRRYKSKDQAQRGVVAVHCVAGLGRAPVMAAVALIEMTALDPMDAVEKIRASQKGAINAKQLKYLQTYKRVTKPEGGCQCTVM
uniref:protein-tyrosine-phosphatase n=1 Tax=Alexandrium monilatum TaxID=311494 RepID=A0A7S4R516_9DINO